MSKFRKKDKKGAPGVNTSSLPDIVFMLLFFFMVATTSKEADPTVMVDQPAGVKTTDMTPYKQRSEIDFIYIGKPMNPARAKEFEEMGMPYMLFMDNVAQSSPDQLYNSNAVRRWKLDKFDSKPARMTKDIDQVITCLKPDKGTPSGIIFDIRKELQEINALKVAYAVKDNSSI
jgi:Biopolymer transport protein ExbD/TolR